MSGLATSSGPDDLVERLKAMARHDEKMVGYATLGGELYAQAAAEIERLRAENARLKVMENQRDEWHRAWIGMEKRAERAEDKIRRMEGKAAKWYEDEIDKMRQRAEKAEAERDAALQSRTKIILSANEAAALLGDRCEALEDERDALRAQVITQTVDGAAVGCTVIKTEILDALRADAERYRWLREEAGKIGPKASVMFRKDEDWANVWDGLSLDAAIDARRNAS